MAGLSMNIQGLITICVFLHVFTFNHGIS